MLDFKVSDGLCVRCGMCVTDCPTRIIRQEGTAVPVVAAEDEEKCMACQHCLAVCPTGALSILGRDPAQSLPLGETPFPALDAVERYVRGRRSVRQFKAENVPAELIQRLLATAANAPTGANTVDLTFTVVDDRAVLESLRVETMEALAAAAEANAIPESMAYITSALPTYFEYGGDMIFRGAPHLLVVSAGPGAMCAHEDVVIALANFEMLAVSAGLGTVWCGLVKMALEICPKLKATIGLPPDNQAYYAMLFGPPAIRYARTVQRDDAATVQRVSLARD